jgi:hypothetical protein
VSEVVHADGEVDTGGVDGGLPDEGAEGIAREGVPVLVGEEPVVADIGMPSPALLDSAGPDFVGDRGIYQPEAVAYPLGLDRDEVGSTAESRDRSVST